MNISIRNNIINNFKNTNEAEIKKSIQEAIKDTNELALPGLGVFFEILWKNSSNNFQEQIIDKIKRSLI